jgi:cell division protein ftsX
MSRRKDTARALMQQKRRRRQWLTFVRMCRYGVNNFSRNAWLTVAATLVMTITLLIVFTTFVAQRSLADTAQAINKDIDRSIYLRPDVSEERAQPVLVSLRRLSNVESVRFISTEEAKEQFAKANKDDEAKLHALNEATNLLPATIRITLHDNNDTSQLIDFVNTNSALKPLISATQTPTFMSQRRNGTTRIAEWTQMSQKAGVAASVLFIAISFLIIFNTIRMAIFNRRDEIEMMKLIGADRGFIRGPFLVEAVVYGVIAAVIATTLGIITLFLSGDSLKKWGVALQPTIDMAASYWWLIALAMMALGACIGVVSSLVATRRYLKI